MENTILNQKSIFAPLIINKDDLFNLIDIRAPYFALKDIFVDDKSFTTAHVPIEQPLGSEIMPISTGEATRHMAVLGMISCAYANPIKKKHYYLPHAISFKRVSGEYSVNKSNYLLGNSICTSFEKRKAVAVTQLLDNRNHVICEAEIFYHVMPQTVFDKLFIPHHANSPDYSIENPYKIKNELFDIKLSTTNLTASLGKIPQNYCSGHFPNYPAMPMAILTYNLIDLAGLFIYHSTRDYRLRFMLKEFTLSADGLAFAGEKVDLEIKHMRSFDNLFVLSCKATSNGSKNVADLEITIEGIK